MRTSVLPIVLLAMCSVIAPAVCLAQQPSTSPTLGDPDDQFATIAGTVVSANTGELLKKAHVVLSQDRSEGDDPNKGTFAATSDAAGHFSISRIPAGSYTLVVLRDDYVMALYGQDQTDKPGAILTLAAGQKIPDLLFRLQRTGVITGRVRDEDGDPVRGARVTVLRRTTIRGKTQSEPGSSATTDDLGEYRIYGLDPGRYSVRASARGFSLYRIGASSEETEGYLPTYYSGTTDSARASTLEVKSGDEFSGIDFALVPKTFTRTYKIHGHIVISITGYSDAQAVVMALPRGNRELSLEDRKETRADTKTGNFEIKGVVPGEYIVTALVMGAGQRVTAMQRVDVGNNDVDGVSLVVTNGVDILGRIELDGKSAASAKYLRISLDSSEDENVYVLGGPRPAEVHPDGSFILKEVMDGSYSLRVYSTCGECYLKSAKANGVDLLDQGIRVTSGAGPGPVAIVYSSNTGTLAGAVTNKDDLPAAGAMVVLVPDAGSHQKPEQYKTSPTDQYGHFEVRGVPPGHYKAFAWEKVDQESYGDPDFLKPFESKAESFDIAANEQKSVQLKMIPAANSTN